MNKNKKYSLEMPLQNWSQRAKILLGVGVGVVLSGIIVIIIIAATGGFRATDTVEEPVDKKFNEQMLTKTNEIRNIFGAPAVTLGNNLTQDAQHIANHLASINQMKHGWWLNGKFTTRRPDGGYGQNLYVTTGVPSAADAVMKWAEECNNCSKSALCRPNESTGHFTQLVWNTTTQIGCGVATNSSGRTYIVCNYTPAGNMMGEAEGKNLPPATTINAVCPTIN